MRGGFEKGRFVSTVSFILLIDLYPSLIGTLMRRDNPSGWGSYASGGIGLILLTSALTGSALAQSTPPGMFDERDTRVFKVVACTKDKKPVEALYYIAANRSDLSAGKPSPSSELMKHEVEHNWHLITSQLTLEQVIEERFAETYHTLLNEMMPRLQQAVQEKSGVSITVSEVNSRPMDQVKDQDVPTCGSR
jgi:hypothetical protein